MQLFSTCQQGQHSTYTCGGQTDFQYDENDESVWPISSPLFIIYNHTSHIKTIITVIITILNKYPALYLVVPAEESLLFGYTVMLGHFDHQRSRKSEGSPLWTIKVYLGGPPKIVVFTPTNHPFVHRVFHEINHPFWGVSHTAHGYHLHSATIHDLILHQSIPHIPRTSSCAALCASDDAPFGPQGKRHFRPFFGWVFGLDIMTPCSEGNIVGTSG